MYIEFDEFDLYISSDPVSGAIWVALTELERRKWYVWIHNQVNQHPWKGESLANFTVRQAFPRKYYVEDTRRTDYCGYVIIRFDSDPDANQIEDVIIPRQLLAESVVTQLNSSDIDELLQLRDIGVLSVKTGPLETKFQENNVKGNNPFPPVTSLPEPLWSAIGSLSTLSDDYTNKTFTIKRG